MQKLRLRRARTSYFFGVVALASGGVFAAAALADGLPPIATSSIAVTTPSTVVVSTAGVPATVTTPVVGPPTTPPVKVPLVVTAPSVPKSLAKVVHAQSLPLSAGAAVSGPVAHVLPTVAAVTGGASHVAIPASAPRGSQPLLASPKFAAGRSNHVSAPPSPAIEPRRQLGAVLGSPLVGGLTQREPVARAAEGAAPRVTQRSAPAQNISRLKVGGLPIATVGGVAALLAVFAAGLAGAVRSSSSLAALCAEFGRFPFPRFRVLPCPGEAGAFPAASAGAAGVTAQNAVNALPVRSTGGGTTAQGTSLGQPLHSQTSGVLGATLPKPGSRGWELLKSVLLALLVAANAALVAVRWRLGRLQSR